MHSPGHSRAESTTSDSSGNGTGTDAPRSPQQLLALTPHIRQTVDVQLEHLRRVLDTDPVARTQILVDPDLQRLTAGRALLLNAHLSCWCFVPSRPGTMQALTGVEHFDPTPARFPIMFGGYSPGVRESARVKIGHTPTVFVI
ncbi:hypothetical protein GCM10020256_63240 [Streptomyces thermocoprophilus]